jgi:hypothetical protein
VGRHWYTILCLPSCVACAVYSLEPKIESPSSALDFFCCAARAPDAQKVRSTLLLYAQHSPSLQTLGC